MNKNIKKKRSQELCLYHAQIQRKTSQNSLGEISLKKCRIKERSEHFFPISNVNLPGLKSINK